MSDLRPGLERAREIVREVWQDNGRRGRAHIAAEMTRRFDAELAALRVKRCALLQESINAALPAPEQCPGCHGSGYDEEVDIGVGTLRNPCRVCTPAPDASPSAGARDKALEQLYVAAELARPLEADALYEVCLRAFAMLASYERGEQPRVAELERRLEAYWASWPMVPAEHFVHHWGCAPLDERAEQPQVRELRERLAALEAACNPQDVADAYAALRDQKAAASEPV